jgi:hypothetical protein
MQEIRPGINALIIPVLLLHLPYYPRVRSAPQILSHAIVMVALDIIL